MGMVVRELRAFHLPKSLKCKLWGWRREACRQISLPAGGHSTHIRPLSAPPCAPGLPPYPVRPLTWGGKRVRSSVTARTADNNVGRRSGLLLRKLLSKGGLSCTEDPQNIVTPRPCRVVASGSCHL